jgi:hypothetical protein
MLTETASPHLLMSPDDNCLIARVALPTGTRVVIDGAPVPAGPGCFPLKKAA